MKNERYLYFKYPYDYTTKEQINNIETLLHENNIAYVFYQSSGYYPHEFYIAKSGKTWDNIMRLINSVKAPKYDYISSNNQEMFFDETENKYKMRWKEVLIYHVS